MSQNSCTNYMSNIRLATKQDLHHIKTCATTAYSQYISVIGREPAPMNADYLQQIQAGLVFVAEHQNSFAGFIVIYAQDDHLHIENVAVSPVLTGKGIGRTLIHYAESKAIEKGLYAVELYTNEAMQGNLLMYPKLGYKQIAKREDEGFKRVYFRKEL